MLMFTGQWMTISPVAIEMIMMEVKLFQFNQVDHHDWWLITRGNNNWS